MLKYMMLTSGLCLMLACQPIQPSGHSHGGDTHTHEEEADHSHDDEASVSYTKWTDQVELFVEFKPLVIGELSQFAAHFTTLADYEPVREGQVTVSLIIGNKGIRQTVEAPSSPGIFLPGLQPSVAGNGRLIFDVTTPTMSEQIVLEGIRVFSSMEEATAALPEEGAPGDVIDFLKEQAWKINFKVQPVKSGELSEAIKTTGQVLPMQGDEQVVASPSSGMVIFANSSMLPGREVRKGAHLFSLLTAGDPQENLEAQLEKTKAKLQKAEAEYSRRKSLLQDQAISQKAVEESELEFELAKVEMKNLTKYLSEGGRKVYASHSGYIKEVEIEPGDFVETGTSVLTITQNRKLQLVADVPQQYFPKIKQIRDADIKTTYKDHWESIKQYNGRMISYAQSISLTEPFIPVYFELNNTGDLLPGSFVELVLFTGEAQETIVVPRSALIEEYGSFYVMVQLSGESFEKRMIKTGFDHGNAVQVLDGLQRGEMIVTEGAYQVKMASMASSVPAHGHTH